MNMRRSKKSEDFAGAGEESADSKTIAAKPEV
jgi:hypothetical protein